MFHCVRCTEYDQCEITHHQLGWLSYPAQECPKIDTIFPEQIIQYESNKTSVRHIPYPFRVLRYEELIIMLIHTGVRLSINMLNNLIRIAQFKETYLGQSKNKRLEYGSISSFVPSCQNIYRGNYRENIQLHLNLALLH